MPVDDPLLSRISVDISDLRVENIGGWRLPTDIRQAWQRLEKALWLISDLLLDALATPYAQAIRAHESWDRPQDHGYLTSFPSQYAALRAARQAHKSFLFLAARCSLAVACYQAAHPHLAVGGAPSWLTFLTGCNIPPCWLDALRRSVITQFSHGIRAGVAIDLSRCPWPLLIPVMQHARIPLFLYWESENAIKYVLANYPFAQSLVPHRTDWIEVLKGGPPASTRDGTFHLYRHGHVRIHPEHVDDPTRPPHGPYQRPGERLEDFLTRQKRRQQELRSGEGPAYAQRRAAREEHAKSGLPPHPRTRVYVWMRLGDALPASPLLWHEKPYRMLVAPSAVRGLWAVQPPAHRSYNPYVDEWDMWLPPSQWLERHETQGGLLAEQQIAPAEDVSPSSGSAFVGHVDRSSIVVSDDGTIPSARKPSDEDIGNLCEDLRSLYPSVADWSQKVFIQFRRDFVQEWYGFRPPFPRSTEEVMKPVLKYLHGVLGILEKTQPFERDEHRTLAACVTAVLAQSSGSTDSVLLRTTWDLHKDTTHEMRGRRHVQRCITAVHEGTDGVHFLVKFAKDPTTLPWNLALSGSALVWLLRRGNVVDSHEAVRELVLCGIAFHTVLIHPSAGGQPEPALRPSDNANMLDCRIEGYAAGTEDYQAYMTRVLEILHRPHARVGLMKGGIVWRLIVEAVGHDNDLRERFVDCICAGPSGEAYVHAIFEAEELEYADDDLSGDELNVICGLYAVFTGMSVIDACST